MGIHVPETVDELKDMEKDFESALETFDEQSPAATPLAATPPATPPVAEAPPATPPAAAPATPPVATTPPAAPPIQPENPLAAPAPVAPLVDPKKVQEQVESLRKLAPAPVAPPVVAPPAAEQPPAQPAAQPQRQTLRDPLDELSEDEKKSLQQFGEDWPDVNAALGINNKVYTGRVALLMTAYHQNVMGQIHELQERLNSLTGEFSNTNLRTHVPEYDSLRANVQAWVNTIPEAFRGPYQLALDSNDPVKFAGLAEQYQKTLTTTPPTQTTPPGKTVRQPPSGQHLAPVAGRRSAISTAADPDDEDGAFAEALRATAGK